MNYGTCNNWLPRQATITSSIFLYYSTAKKLILIVASEKWCKESNASNVSSVAVEKERMNPGHWFGSVLPVRMVVGKDIQQIKTICATYPPRFSSGAIWGRTVNPGTGKTAIKMDISSKVGCVKQWQYHLTEFINDKEHSMSTWSK